MAELRPIQFDQLLRRMLVEPARQQTLFDLPLRKAWRPREGLDLSVAVHGHRAETPVGPAAGPHAQLAQNIVLSWLGGSRVIELKTVQILDELKIPRPCIDAATVGFNVEWSQELKLADSLREYVAGWMLIRMLRHLDPLGVGAAVCARSHPVFELSVGYDLKGLQQPAMRQYFAAAQNVAPLLMQLQQEIPREHKMLRDLDYAPDMVSCVTLSTFHGCPPEEIEAIARYLIAEIGVDVIVKLNPTLLGFDEVQYLLHDRMGYHELRPRKAAFDGDLAWQDAIGLGRRLADEARRVGRSFGVKMTNTLVVENHKTFFGGEEMYLSGPPLHVLAMSCVDRWRAAFGGEVPISFSGGIDQHNFADAVACDLVPVTTCTDLLRPGGYGRLPRYLSNLEDAMVEAGARDRDELILHRFGQGAEAARLTFAELREEGRADGADAQEEARVLDALKARAPIGALVDEELRQRIVRMAGLLNTHEVTARVTGDPRYAAGKNAKPPRKVGSTLVLLDCLSCDKCVPVCPNDANFSIETPPEELAYEDLVLDGAGAIARATGGLFAVKKDQQWANLADACNECGNCDVFCPEDGGPYVMKARFFASQTSFEASPALDGLWVAREGAELRVTARLQGRRYQLRVPPRGPARLDDGVLAAEYDPSGGGLLSATALPGARGPHRLSGAVFLTLRALVRGALDVRRINAVSAAVELPWPGA
jgi:putative selenate reductase